MISRHVMCKLLTVLRPLATIGAAVMILAAATGLAMDPAMSWQDEESSSRRESAAIKAVEKAGGRVNRISAADTTREVSFNLASTPIGDQHLKGINAIGEIIWLNLAGTEVTDAGLKHLAGLPLKKLHLERTKIGDEGLKHLKSFEDLEYLNVYDTKVTDAGLEHLKGLKNLKKLYVWKSGVTEAGMKKLNESLPELEIVGELKLKPVVVDEPKKKEAAETKEPAEKKEPAKNKGKQAGPEKKGADKVKPNKGAEKKQADKAKAEDK